MNMLFNIIINKFKTNNEFFLKCILYKFDNGLQSYLRLHSWELKIVLNSKINNIFF